ncbi:I78 family peptidase inhibitor [Allopusillimonas ginsengisoli]|uniref:I78 family peptidase inhibitor n=1 Tax=Allopusillimonas ginsengisoli TaxID=453575 RepID=UPI00101F6326|nr:I78 family peptidase inhibitor [Allopusillimonas ginsengisoli]TEA77714.1 hypothetical protein ERE07_13855 [Allopusillimonas ginsengisoli]
MFKRSLLAVVVSGSLAACVAPTQSSAPTTPGVCSTERTSSIQGHHISPELEQKAEQLSGASTVRVLRPGQVITREYRADRLNLQLDSYDVVVRVHCG